MTGWLAARFSRRAILIWGVIGFTCASLACGLATSLEGLVLFRVLQGAFGAPLVPLSQAIVMDSYPRERQAAALAIFGMGGVRSDEHTSELQSLMRVSYAVFWLTTNKTTKLY